MVEQVRRRPALTLLSPSNPQQGAETHTYTAMIWREHRVYLRPSSLTNGIRISAAHCNTVEVSTGYLRC
jgi:hypothetical protein